MQETKGKIKLTIRQRWDVFNDTDFHDFHFVLYYT